MDIEYLHRLGDVLQTQLTPVVHRNGNLAPYLIVGRTRQAYASRGRDALKARGHIDTIAHEVSVGFHHHVTDIDANSEINLLVRREIGISSKHLTLQINGAANSIDRGCEFDQHPVSRRFDDVTVISDYGWIDEVLPQLPEPCERSFLVGPGQSTVAGNVGGQDRSKFPLKTLPDHSPFPVDLREL